jgi:hypothetical protein
MQLRTVALSCDLPSGRGRVDSLRRRAAVALGGPLEVFLGPRVDDGDAQAFLDGWTDAQGVPRYMAHLLGVLQVLGEWGHGEPTLRSVDDGEELLLLLEDDAVFCPRFLPRLEAAVRAWQAERSKQRPRSQCLRIGYLPSSNVAPPFPVGAACLATGEGRDAVHFGVARRVVGMQATVLTREGARAFLAQLGVAPASVGRGAVTERVERLDKAAMPTLSVKPTYGARWGYTPTADFLLDTPAMAAATVIPPLVMETEEAQAASSINSGGDKSGARWEFARAHGFRVEDW